VRGADGLACAGLWENDMPEIEVRSGEGNTHKAVFKFLPQGSDVAFHGLRSHLIENPDVLAGDQRRVHKQKRAVGADNIRGGFQINRFAFGQPASDFQGNLKREAYRSPTFRVSSPLHKETFKRPTQRMLPRRMTKDKAF
jgi:hypothetical protein